MEISDKIQLEIKNRVGDRRYQHILRVVAMAKELALVHNENIEKAMTAAYFHDCAKISDKNILIKTANQYGLELDDELLRMPQLIHGFLGAKMAEDLYEITDSDILNAIKYHTTGRSGMSVLEKIVFLADYVEYGRQFKGVKQARKLAMKDLDQGMLFALKNNIKYLISNNNELALDSIHAYNDFARRARE